MYGTIARMKLKPDSFEKLEQQMSAIQSELKAAGWHSTTVYRSDSDPNEAWLAVVFESKEAYHANAQSPEQGKRYEQMRALLEADPEWHDGEVVSMANA
jgi:quinol monooxygenase YgiN